MRVYLLRHGIAAPHDPRQNDDSRALTPEGKKKMKTAARGMKSLDLRIDRILSSPLVRCRETAGAVSEALEIAAETLYTPALAPATKSAEMLRQLLHLPASSSILLVGHEPSLSHFASFLLTGQDRSLSLAFKKGGLCRIDFTGKPRSAGGTLVFHLPPRALRRAAGKSS